MKKVRRRNGPQWRMIGIVVILKSDLVGNAGEIFKRGTAMIVSSEPLGRLAGAQFNLRVTDEPEFHPGGPWRGVARAGLTQFEVM